MALETVVEKPNNIVKISGTAIRTIETACASMAGAAFATGNDPTESLKYAAGFMFLRSLMDMKLPATTLKEDAIAFVSNYFAADVAQDHFPAYAQALQGTAVLATSYFYGLRHLKR